MLRKFKNSNGWQKLWVVFTNFCLFFYKTHQVGNAAAGLRLGVRAPGSPWFLRLGAAWRRVGQEVI